jgi:hypothetical protein
MLRRLRAAASAALFLPPLVVGACGDGAIWPTAPRRESDGTLVAVVGRDELWLVNRGNQTVYTFVIDQESLALADWAPCVDARCGPILPGAQRAVPLGDAYGLRHGHRAVVNWWNSVQGPDDAPVPGEIHSLVVQL